MKTLLLILLAYPMGLLFVAPMVAVIALLEPRFGGMAYVFGVVFGIGQCWLIVRYRDNIEVLLNRLPI